MTNNGLYTIVLDYKGGTYIGQAYADSLTNALAQWLSGITDEELARWQTTRDELSNVVNSDRPIPLSGCTNVWCLSGSIKDSLALINVIATQRVHTELT
jgi:hypothetical protein